MNWKEQLAAQGTVHASELQKFIETEIIEKLIEDSESLFQETEDKNNSKFGGSFTGYDDRERVFNELRAKWLN